MNITFFSRNTAIAAILATTMLASPLAAQNTNEMTTDVAQAELVDISAFAAVAPGLSESSMADGNDAALEQTIVPRTLLIGSKSDLNTFFLSEQSMMMAALDTVGAFDSQTGQGFADHNPVEIDLAALVPLHHDVSYELGDTRQTFRDDDLPEIDLDTNTSIRSGVPINRSAGHEYEDAFIGATLSAHPNTVFDESQEVAARTATITRRF